MTRLDLDRIEAAARAATPGPWEHGNRQLIAAVIPSLYGEGRCAYCEGYPPPTWQGHRNVNGVRTLVHIHALPEPWYGLGIYAYRGNGSIVVVDDSSEYGPMLDADAEHIATMDPATTLALVARVREAEARALPDADECACTYYEEDRGGCYSEPMVEYEPACPQHSTHLYDPRTRTWVAREDPDAEAAAALWTALSNTDDDAQRERSILAALRTAGWELVKVAGK